MKHLATHPLIKSRFAHIEAALIKAVGTFQAEDIHAFRVEIKKLRAFLRLASNSKQFHLPKDLHTFYRLAGHIRNLELQQQRILDAFRHKTRLPQSYLNFLGIETAISSLAARDYVRKKVDISKAQDSVLAHLPSHLDKPNIHHFLRQTDDQLRTAITLLPPLSDEALHDLRKCLKDLQYNLPFVKKEAAHLLPAALLEKKNQLACLTEALGRYQDLRAGLLLLAPGHLQQIKDDSEKKLLDTLRTRWDAEKQAAGIHLHALLSKMLSRKSIATDAIVDAPFTT